MEPSDKPADKAGDSEAKDRLNNAVAVTVAILACFMAITKVKDDNICQAMEKEKANEVNTWSYYQSKSVKQNLAELGRDQLAALSLTTSGDARVKLDADVAAYKTEIARYESEKANIKTEAEQHGKNYDTLNFRDDQFDLSDATLSVAIVLLAVTALTAKRWMLVTGWVVGTIGSLMGLAGLFGWNLHPGWLIRMLS